MCPGDGSFEPKGRFAPTSSKREAEDAEQPDSRREFRRYVRFYTADDKIRSKISKAVNVPLEDRNIVLASSVYGCLGFGTYSNGAPAGMRGSRCTLS